MVSFIDKCENDSFNQIYFNIWAITMIYTVQSHAEMDNVDELFNLGNHGT